MPIEIAMPLSVSYFGLYYDFNIQLHIFLF